MSHEEELAQRLKDFREYFPAATCYQDVYLSIEALEQQRDALQLRLEQVRRYLAQCAIGMRLTNYAELIDLCDDAIVDADFTKLELTGPGSVRKVRLFNLAAA